MRAIHVMNKPFMVDTPYAGLCILEPLGDGCSVRLHWDGKVGCDTREQETPAQAVLHARAADWLKDEGFIAFAAGRIQFDPEIQQFFKDID